MSAKTPVQEKLEAQRQKGIREIVVEALNENRGDRLVTSGAAKNLGVSKATLYQWCRELEINPAHYRQLVRAPRGNSHE